MEVRFCHNCGKQLKEGAKFCAGCGTPVLQLPQETPAPAPAPAEPVPVKTEVVVQEEPIVENAPVETAEAVPEEVSQIVPEAPVAEETVAENPVAEEVVEEPAFIPAAEPIPAVEESAPAPAAEPVPAAEQPAKPKKDPYPRRGVGRTILAILICLFIFLWSFTAIMIYNVRSATSGEQLTKNLESVLKNTDLVSLPASQLIPDAEEDVTIVQWVIQEIADNYDGEVVASEKDIEKFLEKSTFSDFIIAKLGLYMNDLYTGSDDFEISVEEIEGLLEDNADLMEDLFDTPVYQEDIENFVAELEDREILESLEVSTLKEEIAPVYYGVQIGLSYWVIGFFALLALLFILWLSATNKWNMLRTCGDTGITWTVLGALLCLPALVTLIVPSIWSDLLGNIPFVDSLISSVLRSTLIPAAILLGVGILLIVVKVVGKKLVLKSAMKKQV